MIGVGLVPGYLISLTLNRVGLLRVSPDAELAGLDVAALGVVPIGLDGTGHQGLATEIPPNEHQSESPQS